MKILLLGVGKQGKSALHDLMHSKDVKEIIAVDNDLDRLQSYVKEKKFGSKLKCEYLDACNSEIINNLFSQKPDVIIDLLPVPLMDFIAQFAVKHSIHLVNTFFTSPKIKELSTDAKRKNITILPEFGLDPGIDLVLLGKALLSVDEVTDILSYGAGIPDADATNNPLKYKVTWTFEGVLRAYKRKSYLIKDGKIVEIADNEIFNKKNVHLKDIDGLGKLEAYPNGDASKFISLLGLDQAKIKHLGCYTLRWPGHCAFWKKLVDLHFLDNEPLEVDGTMINRQRFLANVIEPHIKLGPQDRDIALVRLEVIGKKDGQKIHSIHQLLDHRDLKTGLTAMSRTVGCTASIGAQMIGSGKISKRGVLSPVKDIPYDLFFDELRKRGIKIVSQTKV